MPLDIIVAGRKLFLHRHNQDAATTTLFGASLFPLYAFADAEPEGAGGWRRKLLLLAAIPALASGLLWFVFAAASMTGSLSDLADAEELWAVVHDTGFGVIWTGRMILAAVMIIGLLAVRPLTTATANMTIAALAAVLLASLAGAWHTQVDEGWASLVHVLSDAAIFSPPAHGWEGSPLSPTSSLARILIPDAHRSRWLYGNSPAWVTSRSRRSLEVAS